ncbi:hypothetical protein HKK55_08020 [Pseudomonas sp. ADAK18]|uniref:hypothetical protein n=1 Tax=Pseudomonas sp. ADAK18 TaxID=2730848 RepID=UPI0014641FD7|nr:hypothetical protein [Pseudomonas sp. ADAK18]QJI28667.1 hypothetical protein HKK55_08020 [Pseudomonas sp. ADAK18]
MAAVPVWVSLITAVLGGGIVSGSITFILETKRSEKNLLRTKLEELHTAFDRSSRNLTIIHELLSQYAKGESDLQGFLSESTSYVDKFSEPTTERVSALCAIYFPELTICHKSFTRARERFTELMNDRARLMSRPEGFESSVEDSYDFLKEMDEAMRKAIYRCAANINLAWTSRMLNKVRFLGK